MEKETYKNLGCRLQTQMPTEAGGSGHEGDRLGGPMATLRRTQHIFNGNGSCSALPDDCHMGMEPLCGQIYPIIAKDPGKPGFWVKSEMLNVGNFL